MSWLWPGFLYLLGMMPVMVAAYIWVLRRRRRFAVRYSSLALVRDALPRQSRLRRHAPFALLLFALTSLVIALSRPVAVVRVPTGQTAIILAIDVSLSMCSTDIPPNRLTAAEAAAQKFIQSQGASTQIGVVAFAGFAELIQPPTNDQEVLQDAVASLIPGRRTAIGSGILASLDAIAEIDESVAPTASDSSTGAQPTPVPKGAYAPDIIVLLTDGVSNSGPLPLGAAQQAADRGVRVYTIGFGTENEFSPFGGRRCQERNSFGGGSSFGGGGSGFRRGIDEATLKQVSEMTGGEYYFAESADELQTVFENLPTYLIARHETTEISFMFVAVGALLAAIAMTLAQMWHPLP